MKNYIRYHPIPTESKFEYFCWIFMRVSGVLLIFLVIGHFLLMHLKIGVENLNSEFVISRMKKFSWRFYDSLLLFFGFIHGLNGVRIIIGDYLHGGIKKLTLIILYTISLILFVGGIIFLF